MQNDYIQMLEGYKVPQTVEADVDELENVDLSDAEGNDIVRGSKTIVKTLMRALNAAKNRRTKADLQVKQLERVLKQFRVQDE